MDRQFPGAWVKNPRTMLDNAGKKARELVRTTPNRCPLDEKKETTFEVAQSVLQRIGKWVNI